MPEDEVEGSDKARIADGPAGRGLLLEVDVALAIGQGIGRPVIVESIVEAAVLGVRIDGGHPDTAQDDGQEDEGDQPTKVDIRPEAAQKGKGLPARQGLGVCRRRRLSSRRACLSIGQGRRAPLSQGMRSEASLYTRRRRQPT